MKDCNNCKHVRVNYQKEPCCKCKWGNEKAKKLLWEAKDGTKEKSIC